MSSKKIFLLIILSSAMCNCTKFTSLDNAYEKGVQAYTKQSWAECILQFEESLHLYKLYRSIIINCRLKCRSHNFEPAIKEGIEDLHIFEIFFNTKSCLTKCHNQGFRDVHIYGNVSNEILENMQARRPYEYLHVCYYQKHLWAKAASAAYTYLVVNPHEETMKANVAYYVQQPEVDPNEVIDLESDDYKILFELGIKAYKQKNWGETIAYMEEALSGYLIWENNCRAECERLPEQEWSPEFANIISNYMASLLLCRQRCQNDLKPQYGTGVQFLGDVLNYLQISYYHLDKLQDAAQTVTSYLILMPADEDMLHNKQIYETLVDKSSFKERSDISHYLKRDTYEKKLLIFFLQDSENTVTSNIYNVL